jgi:transposase InsO family protein
MDVRAKLAEIYLRPGGRGGFSSDRDLLEHFRRKHPNLPISLKTVHNFLQREVCYSLHRKRFKTIPRNIIFAPRLDIQWSADLIDFKSFTKYNDEYRYILVVIDCLSRYLYTMPLKTKGSTEMATVLEKMFNNAGKTPLLFNSDSGGEFINKAVQGLLKRKGIHYFSSFGDIKASMAERVIKTLKQMIFRYFDHTLQRQWVDKLDLFTSTYNSNYNRSIKMTPNDAIMYPNNVLLSEKLFKNVASKACHKVPGKVSIGDIVRLNLNLGLFGKNYEASWSRAIYRVVGGPYHTIGGTIPMYKIAELNGEVIKGGLLPQEILKICPQTFLENYAFPIEKIITRGPKKSLVKFLGYTKRDNEWLPNTSIKNIAQL